MVSSSKEAALDEDGDDDGKLLPCDPFGTSILEVEEVDDDDDPQGEEVEGKAFRPSVGTLKFPAVSLAALHVASSANSLFGSKEPPDD